jgi:hypothetical protein
MSKKKLALYVAALPVGTYLLLLISEEGKSAKKILKERLINS